MLPGEQDPNNVIIEIDVLEHKTGTINIRCWTTPNLTVLMGIIEFGEENFRGTGDKFKVHWEIGGKKKIQKTTKIFLLKNLGSIAKVHPLASPSSTVKMNTQIIMKTVMK